MYIRKTSDSLVLVDSNMRIIPEVLDYTRYLEAKGMSINTITSYLEKLRVFYKWMESEGLKAFEVEPRHMPGFIKYIDDAYAKKYTDRSKVAASTLNGYLATLGNFYDYFGFMGFVEPADYKLKDKNKTTHLSYLKHINKKWGVNAFSFFSRKVRKRVDKKRLSEQEAKMFYETIGEFYVNDESLKVRNQLIFKLLYETGLRIGELLHLRINDYDLPEPFKQAGNIYLIERGKLDNADRQLKTGERTIPVSAALLEKIDDYVLYHRPQVGECDYIIVNHRTKHRGLPPTRASMEEMFRKVYAVCHFQKKCVTPHSLRHTHASNLADMGIDISVIKARLGHKSIGTTNQYIDVSIETLTLSYGNYLESKKGSVF
ncbi:tyrosine-type recombinase/integrase [Bacillus mycoides]